MDDLRIFRLVDLLQGRGRMTTGDLATRLGVSERTVRRDIARLHALDVPVTATPGRRGGIAVEPGALLAPLRFTDDELLALLLGLKSMASAPETNLAAAGEGALRRLENVMTPRARARAQALNDVVLASPTGATGGAMTEGAPILELAEAIHAHRRIRLRYASATRRETQRSVDPLGLVRIGNWYLAAYCHLREGMRTFRLDRVRSLAVTSETFDPPEAFDAFSTVAASLAQAPVAGSIVCRVRIATDLETASRGVPPAVVVLEADGEAVLLSVRAHPHELERVALHLMGMPWPLEVLGPPELRSALRALGERAIATADRRSGHPTD